jgi:toxin YhaV
MIDITADPGNPKFRQGDTLGSNRKHWYRAKFFQQYRLFYRFDSRAKVIVFAWVNDDTTLRAYGSGSDAYSVFARMLSDGNPPDDFPALLKEAEAAAEQARALLKAAAESLAPPPV